MKIVYLRFKNSIVNLTYKLVGRFWTKPNLYPIGKYKIYLDPKEGLSAWKRRFGSWEPEYFYKLAKYIKEDEIILEFGSCMGYTGLYLLNASQRGKLYGIEPFPTYFSYLTKTMKANHKDRNQINFYQLAYSPTEEMIDFKISDINPYADLSKLNKIPYKNNSKKYRLKNDLASIKVPALNFTKIISYLKVTPTFVHMDIEGAEYYLIEEIIGSGVKPVIAWETHQMFYGQKKLTKILDLLTYSGYKNTKLDQFHYISLPSRRIA